VCEDGLLGHPELWISSLAESKGPEKNLEAWRVAENTLDGICKTYERTSSTDGSYDAVLVAVVDAYNRCIEERRRAEDLLKLHEKWAERRVGGVVEPESPVRK